MVRKLVAEKGVTSVYINVEINEGGDLVFSGQDIGEASQNTFGDSDYEYWLTIKSADKPRLLYLLKRNSALLKSPDETLLDLIEMEYSGDTRVVSKMMDLLKQNGIEYSFYTF